VKETSRRRLGIRGSKGGERPRQRPLDGTPVQDPPAPALPADELAMIDGNGAASPGSVADRVAELLEATGLLPADSLARVRRLVRGDSMAQAIVDAGLVPHVLAAQHDLPLVNLSEIAVDVDAATTLPATLLDRVGALPYALDDGRLKIAIADPNDVQMIDELRLATRYSLELAVAPREDIELELRKIMRANEMWERAALVQDESFEAVGADELEVDDGISDAPLVRLVNSIILQAAEDGASDVHFNPLSDSLVVRMRVDGLLHEMQRLPKRLASPVTTRLKVLSKLDIAERRKPQDGRISLTAAAAGRPLDIRVAVLPSVEGETVVMRLLDKSRRAPTLSELGLSDGMRGLLEGIIRKPTGALLVTGPTGSGKSTTLYAFLNEINRSEINIITVEDPVEYRLAGVNQVQINPKAGLTFANALRTILRSDPDVIMVGEIRDVETAKISIESALTGHFVLSTLHTNDAPGALTRLNEMGVEPFLTGSAVTAVLAQRLARRLCTHCYEAYTPTPEELAGAGFTPEQIAAAERTSLYRKVGCPRCSQTGYRGRIGVFQLMVMSEQLERLASQFSSHDEIGRAAYESGMRSLWDDGVDKVLAGLTSLEEIGRVLV
jgi:type IV pilus assembly protein PilB